MNDDFDIPDPQIMMGSASTAATVVRKVKRPMGFIWPQASKRGPLGRPRRPARSKPSRGRYRPKR